MYSFHEDKKRYFEMQKSVTEKDVIPYLKPFLPPNANVLEIGCAEAGVLKAFIDQGHYGVGIELNKHRATLAQQFLKDDIQEGRGLIINKNIYDIIDPEKEISVLFDIIVLKDVIEHIPDQNKFISTLHKFLKPEGYVFFAYPPWWMPFGGHQQICSHKILRVLPWFHLLPMSIYVNILKICGEQPGTINELQDIKKTGVIIEDIKNHIHSNNFGIKKETYWLINPIYSQKFGLKPRKLANFLTKIPYLRNFYTSAHYVVFGLKQSNLI